MPRPYDVQNNPDRLCCVFRTMDDHTILFILPNELVKIFIEMLDHLRADRVRTLSSLAPIRNGLERQGASLQATLCVVVQCRLEGFVIDRFANSGPKTLVGHDLMPI